MIRTNQGCYKFPVKTKRVFLEKILKAKKIILTWIKFFQCCNENPKIFGFENILFIDILMNIFFCFFFNPNILGCLGLGLGFFGLWVWIKGVDPDPDPTI